MLRISLIDEIKQITLKLEGDLKGPWVGELERSWLAIAAGAPTRSVRVDLTDAGFVDAEGQILIEDMAKAGVELIATGIMMNALVADILARIRDSKGSGGEVSIP